MGKGKLFSRSVSFSIQAYLNSSAISLTNRIFSLFILNPKQPAELLSDTELLEKERRLKKQKNFFGEMERNIMKNLSMGRLNDFQPFDKKTIPYANIKNQQNMCPHDIYYAKALIHSEINLIPTSNEKSNQGDQYLYSGDGESKSLPAIVSPDTSHYTSIDKNACNHHAGDTRDNFLNGTNNNKNVYSACAEFGSSETIKVSCFAFLSTDP